MIYQVELLHLRIDHRDYAEITRIPVFFLSMHRSCNQVKNTTRFDHLFFLLLLPITNDRSSFIPEQIRAIRMKNNCHPFVTNHPKRVIIALPANFVTQCFAY